MDWRTAGIATKHGKETLMRETFHKIRVDLQKADYDTDLLGTFSGEVSRTLSQSEAAITKAQIAINDLGVDVGLGSEGSVTAHPTVPFLHINIETLAWIDKKQDLELLVSFQTTDIFVRRQEIASELDVDDLVTLFDLPNHAVILSNLKKDAVFKGIRSHDQLDDAIVKMKNLSKTFNIETDLRAHFSPSRQKNILHCAQKLVAALETRCPSCDSQGWMVVSNTYGLPCQICLGEVNSALKSEVYGCPKCSFRAEKPVSEGIADPRFCDLCNP